MEHMIAALSDYIHGWQWAAIIALIVLIVIWIVLRRKQ